MNTSEDFEECLTALEEEGYNTLSLEEKYCARRLRDLAESYVAKFEEIAEQGEL